MPPVIGDGTVYNIIATGGVVCGGLTTVQYNANISLAAPHGVVMAGVADAPQIISIAATGGAVLAGLSENNSFYYSPYGTVVVGGNSTEEWISTIRYSYGGAVVGGTAEDDVIVFEESGAVVGGQSVDLTFIPFNGGVVIGGEAVNSVDVVSVGGIVVGSTAVVNFYDTEEGDGGVVVGGVARVSVYKSFAFVSNGNLVLINGNSNSGVSVVYNPTGGVIIDGESEVNFSFNSDLTLLWNVRALIINELTLLWDVGRLPIFWYRVVGKSRDGSTCNLVSDPCCQKYVVNVHARSLSDLCNKLRARRFVLPIESVQRFSTPAERSVIAAAEAAGENFDCNQLTPVEICTIPACADFCVDFDARVVANFDIMRIQVDSFFEYGEDEEAETSGGIFISGSSVCSFDTNLPEFFWTSEGGITVDGEARVTASDYTASGNGGITISGNSDRQSSNWDYVGGVWPGQTGPQFGEESESLSQESTDQIWSLTERALADDGLYSSTDISWGKTSEFLIIRNLQFDIPTDREIMGIKVLVGRLATQVNVRDLEVYLVQGTEVISDNLAKTSIDWPFIETTTAYGSNGFDGEAPWRDPEAEDYTPLTPDDVNDLEFGFAIRVESQASLAVTIAKIDSISVEVFYEHPIHQTLRIGGKSRVVSSAWNYESSGGIRIQGSIGWASLGMKYASTGGVSVSNGTSSIGFNNFGFGGVSIGGSATEQFEKLHFIGEGGVTLEGTALVVPYFVEFEGGLTVGGEAENQCVVNEVAVGGVEIGGIGRIAYFVYESTGGITISGSSDRSTTSWTYESDGGVIVTGQADNQSTDLGLFLEIAEFQAEILNFEVSFDSDEEDDEADILSSTVNKCGCTMVPLKINLEHGIVRSNNFSQFLARNGLTLSRRLEMFYNTVNDSWQRNLHFRGLSPDANTEETWDIVFELQCTSLMGATVIGRDIWKLGMEVFRRNLTTGDDFDTRILFGLYKESICDTNANELNFRVTYDTRADVAIITPDSTIYQTLLFDNIGLFKSPAWTNDPELILEISQTGLDQEQIRVNLTESVLT